MTLKKSRSSTKQSRLSYTQKATARQLNALEKYKAVIAIDPGTNTGISVAVCDDPFDDKYAKKIVVCKSEMIHNALNTVRSVVNDAIEKGYLVLVIVEDARDISSTADKKLGAGSIRRDCSIWEDFLGEMIANGLPVRLNLRKPTGNKFLKMNPESWRRYAKYTETKLPNEHARDSATYLFSYIY